MYFLSKSMCFLRIMRIFDEKSMQGALKHASKATQTVTQKRIRRDMQKAPRHPPKKRAVPLRQTDFALPAHKTTERKKNISIVLRHN